MGKEGFSLIVHQSYDRLVGVIKPHADQSYTSRSCVLSGLAAADDHLELQANELEKDPETSEREVICEANLLNGKLQGSQEHGTGFYQFFWQWRRDPFSRKRASARGLAFVILVMLYMAALKMHSWVWTLILIFDF